MRLPSCLSCRAARLCIIRFPIDQITCEHQFVLSPSLQTCIKGHAQLPPDDAMLSATVKRQKSPMCSQSLFFLFIGIGHGPVVTPSYMTHIHNVMLSSHCVLGMSGFLVPSTFPSSTRSTRLPFHRTTCPKHHEFPSSQSRT